MHREGDGPAVTWLVIAVGAMAGASLRYGVSRWITVGDGPFPFRTLLVNVAGSFVLGVLTGLAQEHGLGTNALLVIGAGFCGSLTTFSTVSVDVASRPRRRWRYGLVMVAACLVAAALGIAIGGA